MTVLPHTVSDSYPHHGPVYQAYRILQVGFVAAPLIAGVDKFTDKLVNWDAYLAPQLATLFGNPHNFMMVVGVIEIIAALGIALVPRYFAYVVAVWLAGIIVNLLMTGGFFDIALRDLGLCLAALALARLAALYDTGITGGILTRRHS